MSSAQTQAILEQAKSLQKDNKHQEAFNILNEAYEKNPNDIDIINEVCMSYFTAADSTDDDDKKQAILDKGLDVAKKAKGAHPNHYAPYKWIAVFISASLEFAAIKDKINATHEIKENAEKSAQLNPNEPIVQHLLGRICFTFAKMGWIEKKAASVLFATPPETSIDETLKYFLASDSIKPTIRNSIFIGEVYEFLKKPQDAKKWYQKAADQPYNGPMETKMHKQAVLKVGGEDYI